MFVMGLDFGAKSVSCLIASEKGEVISEGRADFSVARIAFDSVRREQHPSDWWETAVCVIRDCVEDFTAKGHKNDEIAALAVNGTSGTVLLADENGNALTNAIMFDDSRCEREAAAVSEAAGDFEHKSGFYFNQYSGLPKILWLKENMPREWAKGHAAHQADYITGRLTGIAGVSDSSSALKSGYDIIDGKFGDFIFDMGIGKEKMPRVETPGDMIGCVSSSAAKETGLSTATAVCSAGTDGYASAMSSGAVRPGQWASIIGNTFVIKGVVKKHITDPQGRVYSHKHPEGHFMPGGASNVGGRCLEEVFGKENLKKFDAGVLGLIPTQILIYPLCGEGERFPFVKPDAKKFVIGFGGEDEMYTAHLEGVSYVEKLAFETLSKIGYSIGDTVFAVGGATKGLEWLKIRATVLNKRLLVPKVSKTAMGSAIIAASKTCFSSVSQAADSMVRIEREVTPYDGFVGRYERLYREFKAQCENIFRIEL